MAHVPVLLHEAIDGLKLEAGDTVIDATLGAGGHSSEMVRKYGPTLKIIGFDLDKTAIEIATKNVADVGGDLTVIESNFRHMARELPKIGIEKVNGALFDLGVSSMEFGASGRGFSFRFDEPLLMTLEDTPGEDTITARDIVNSTRENELADLIYKYGEEKFSRGIARGIVDARKHRKIETSMELAEIIAQSVPAFYRNGRINPATKTFQAIRIAVNDELGALEEGVRAAWSLLKPHGRISVITFHSLEDRIVKNLFKELALEGGTIITKKPIVPERSEIFINPRSRSAKLRIIEKI